MKYKFLLLLLFLSFLSVSARKTDKSYIMTYHENGSLFFIRPEPISKTKNPLIAEDLVFDLTYLTCNDSLSYTLTYVTTQQFFPDSLCFQFTEEQYCSPVEIIYVDKGSSEWIYRVKLIIPFSLLEKMYLSESSYQVNIHGKGNMLEYYYIPKKWIKERQKMNDIIDVIKMNKEIKNQL